MENANKTLADSMFRELTEAELASVAGADGQSATFNDGSCRTVCYITIGGITTKHCDNIGDG